MITLIKWSIFLSVAALTAGDKKWEYKLSPSSISAGQRAVLEMKLQIPFGTTDDEAPLIQDDWLTSSNQLQLLDKTFHREKDKWIWRFELTSYKVGRATVPPLMVSFKGETFSTERTFLNTSSTRTQDDLKLREDFGAISPPIDWRYWFKMTLSAILFFFGVLVLKKVFKLFRSKKKITPLEIPLPAPLENPFEWLKRQLIIYRQELEDPAFEVKAVDRLTQIVKEFFSKKNDKPCLCWTTQEFKRLLQADGLAQSIFPVLLLCDQFKFLPTKCADVKGLAQTALSQSESILGLAQK